MKYLVFTINSFRLALEINKVVEILIPGAGGTGYPEKIRAEKSIKYQDKQIPIITLADYLFNIPGDGAEDFRVILCELEGKQLGLLVDNADEIIRLSPDQIILTEKCSSLIKTDFLDGKFVEDEKEIYIVAPDKILSALKTV
jgi:chemotaxis signal transduction protein